MSFDRNRSTTLNKSMYVSCVIIILNHHAWMTLSEHACLLCTLLSYCFAHYSSVMQRAHCDFPSSLFDSLLIVPPTAHSNLIILSLLHPQISSPHHVCFFIFIFYSVWRHNAFTYKFPSSHCVLKIKMHQFFFSNLDL